MSKRKRPAIGMEYSNVEGLAMALSYLDDPSNVPCPSCGAGTIEVIGYLDGNWVDNGRIVTTAPDDEYTVVLYCHGCNRAAALDLSRHQGGNRAAA